MDERSDSGSSVYTRLKSWLIGLLLLYCVLSVPYFLHHNASDQLDRKHSARDGQRTASALADSLIRTQQQAPLSQMNGVPPDLSPGSADSSVVRFNNAGAGGGNTVKVLATNSIPPSARELLRVRLVEESARGSHSPSRASQALFGSGDDRSRESGSKQSLSAGETNTDPGTLSECLTVLQQMRSSSGTDTQRSRPTYPGYVNHSPGCSCLL